MLGPASHQEAGQMPGVARDRGALHSCSAPNSQNLRKEGGVGTIAALTWGGLPSAGSLQRRLIV